MIIVVIILVLLIIILSIILFVQYKNANQQEEDNQQLLTDYQRRVDEMEKLLSDYRSLEQNFDSVGEGYEQALLAFDKMEEDKQKMQNTVNTLRQQTQELQEARQKLSQSLMQKKDIISKAVAEVKKALAGFTGDASRMYRQLNAVLNANDIDMETAIEADDNVIVYEIIDKAVNQSGIGQANYLAFTCEAAEDVRQTMLLTNADELERALAALLENAAKFTTEGSVRLMVRPEGSHLKFVVEDTGSGIPAEDTERVFEPFVKLNSYFDGAGIGLTAARSIARRLNGDVILDTEYAGPGCRFVLTTPF